MKQKIFLVGSGIIGRSTIGQICDYDAALAVDDGSDPLEIVGVADSQRVLFSPDALDPEVLKRAAETKEGMKQLLEQGQLNGELSALLDIAKETSLDGEVIFIDATAAHDVALNFHKRLLSASDYKLVTPNKNPVARSSMQDFRELTRHKGRYDFNPTVMAGGGAVRFALERHDIKDNIFEIEGMFSGTLGFIFSKLEEDGQNFSDIVRDAQKQGLTEPNPYDDLNGVDVARKLVILCRCAGYDVDFEDVKIEPLIEARFGEMDMDTFWRELKTYDAVFRQSIDDARSQGNTIPQKWNYAMALQHFQYNHGSIRQTHPLPIFAVLKML